MTITINPAAATSAFCAPRGNEAELSSANPYAFLAKGTDSVGNPIDIAGSFTPDGKGGISNAAVDYNGITNGPEHLLVTFRRVRMVLVLRSRVVCIGSSLDPRQPQPA